MMKRRGNWKGEYKRRWETCLQHKKIKSLKGKKMCFHRNSPYSKSIHSTPPRWFLMSLTTPTLDSMIPSKTHSSGPTIKTTFNLHY
jgi:hypothetical protein